MNFPAVRNPRRHVMLACAILAAAHSLRCSSCAQEYYFVTEPEYEETLEIKDVRTRPLPKSDIIFMVDNSQSMLEEQNQLRKNFTDFIRVLSQAANDFQIGVINSDISDVVEYPAGDAERQWQTVDGAAVTYTNQRGYFRIQKNPFFGMTAGGDPGNYDELYDKAYNFKVSRGVTQLCQAFRSPVIEESQKYYAEYTGNADVKLSEPLWSWICTRKKSDWGDIAASGDADNPCDACQSYYDAGDNACPIIKDEAGDVIEDPCAPVCEHYENTCKAYDDERNELKTLVTTCGGYWANADKDIFTKQFTGPVIAPLPPKNPSDLREIECMRRKLIEEFKALVLVGIDGSNFEQGLEALKLAVELPLRGNIVKKGVTYPTKKEVPVFPRQITDDYGCTGESGESLTKPQCEQPSLTMIIVSDEDDCSIDLKSLDDPDAPPGERGDIGEVRAYMKTNATDANVEAATKLLTERLGYDFVNGTEPNAEDLTAIYFPLQGMDVPCPLEWVRPAGTCGVQRGYAAEEICKKLDETYNYKDDGDCFCKTEFPADQVSLYEVRNRVDALKKTTTYDSTFNGDKIKAGRGQIAMAFVVGATTDERELDKTTCNLTLKGPKAINCSSAQGSAYAGKRYTSLAKSLTGEDEGEAKEGGVKVLVDSICQDSFRETLEAIASLIKVQTTFPIDDTPPCLDFINVQINRETKCAKDADCGENPKGGEKAHFCEAGKCRAKVKHLEAGEELKAGADGWYFIVTDKGDPEIGIVGPKTGLIAGSTVTIQAVTGFDPDLNAESCKGANRILDADGGLLIDVAKKKTVLQECLDPDGKPAVVAKPVSGAAECPSDQCVQ